MEGFPNATEKIAIAERGMPNCKDFPFFMKSVSALYFIDIYHDLCKRSDDRSLGVDKVTLLEYWNLPGMVGERFFSLFDIDKNGYVSKKEFVRGFNRIFSSSMDTSIKLTFEFYDFDDDSFINKEDVRIILSYVPICESANKEKTKEGIFTSGLGAQASFLDRKEAQEEIQLLLDEMFKDKNDIDFKEFKTFNQEVSSEAILWILNTLRNSLPCTNNFYLYQRNYQKILEKGSKPKTPKEISTNRLSATPLIKSSPLASPSMSKKFLASSMFASAKSSKKELNKFMSSKAQNPLLKYALGPDQYNNIQTKEESKAKGAGFKSALKQNEEKNKRMLEMSEFEESQFNFDYNAVRMPNKKAKIHINAPKKKEEVKIHLTVNSESIPINTLIQSPSGFLNGKNKVKRDTCQICICGRMPIKDDEDCCPLCEKKDIKKEGYLLRKAKKKNKLTRDWFSLLGRELYYYRSKKETQHKNLYILVGVFLIKEEPEVFQDELKLYPFTLVFTHKRRTFYLIKEEERDSWLEVLKGAVGYSDFFDFYKTGGIIGRGKFSVVKSAIHLKTGKQVAVKILPKTEKTKKDLELQRREIEILKIWQHPNIIRLLDIFENNSTLFLVLENWPGGDMFDYLQMREFDIEESKAKIYVRKISNALAYLHSFGIAYRDLKPENILMSSSGDDADIKISDFGLSKIFAPKEKSDEPFGTISYAAPEVLLGENYDRSVDIWSLGVVTYLLVSGTLPFDDDNEDLILERAIKEEPDYYSPWIAKVSKEWKDFIKNWLSKGALS